MRTKRAWVTWTLTLLLLAFFATRLHGISSFPPFIDEGLHIYFGERSLSERTLRYLTEGRVFSIGWYALFQSYMGATFWTARTAETLLVTFGCAAAVGVGRMIAGGWGGLFAGLLLLFSRYHHFYGRLALTDPLVSAWGMTAIYLAARLRVRAHLRDAALCGVALALAILAKIAALPLLLVPFAAAWSLRPSGRPWQTNVRWLMVAALVSIGLSVGYVVGARLLGYDTFAIASAYNPNLIDGLLPRLLSNMASWVEMVSSYWTLPVLLLTLASVAWVVLRRDAFLPLCLLAPMGLLWFGQRQSSRFFDTALVLLLVCAGIALAGITVRRALWRWSALALLIAYGAFHWLPFARTAVERPADLPLYWRDQYEYITSDASGFGLPELRAALMDAGAQDVTALMANCHGLRYLVGGDTRVTCPPLNPSETDRFAPYGAPDGVTFVILEDLPYVPADVQNATAVGRHARPHDGVMLTLYRLD